jgi:hypothetical protein
MTIAIAPGAPGSRPTRTSSAKDMVTTALGTGRALAVWSRSVGESAMLILHFGDDMGQILHGSATTTHAIRAAIPAARLRTAARAVEACAPSMCQLHGAQARASIRRGSQVNLGEPSK